MAEQQVSSVALEVLNTGDGATLNVSRVDVDVLRSGVPGIPLKVSSIGIEVLSSIAPASPPIVAAFEDGATLDAALTVLEPAHIAASFTDNATLSVALKGILRAYFEDNAQMSVVIHVTYNLQIAYTDGAVLNAALTVIPNDDNTAYSHYSGSGMRQGIFTTTTDLVSDPEDSHLLINSNEAREDVINFLLTSGANVAGKFIQWTFNGAPRIVRGFKLFKENGGNNENYKFQGYDGSTWHDLVDWVHASGTGLIEKTFANDTAYQAYRFLGVSGTTTSVWWFEVEFKVNGTDIDSGDRRGVVTLTSDAVLGDASFNVGRDITASIDGQYLLPDDNDGALIWYFRPSNDITGREIKFQFVTPTIIKRAAWQGYTPGSSGAGAVGTWKWQGSQDGSTWVDLCDPFVWTTNHNDYNQDTTQPLINDSPYLFYRMLGVSGVISQIVQFNEVLFETAPVVEGVLEADFTDNAQLKVWVNRPPFIPFSQTVVVISGT